MPLNKLAMNVYFLSIFSLFLPFTAYIPLFLLFICIVFINSLGKAKIKTHYFGIVIGGGCFMVMATISHLVNLGYSDLTQFAKLILDFGFLLTFIVFFANNADLVKKEINKKLPFLIEIILLLTFFQILANLVIMDLWMMPFIGVQNSMEAYLVVVPDIYFGTKEKNIWATKLVLVSIIYISFGVRNIWLLNKCRFYTFCFIILFNTLYTFSRTAQLILIAFIFLYALWKIFYIYKNIVIKFLSICMLFSMATVIGIIIVDKLLHITLSSGDGLAARFELWKGLYEHYLSGNMCLLIGNGILSGKYIIPYYTNWSNNNFHNVFLNLFSDMGIFAPFIYLLILKNVFLSKYCDKINNRFSFLVLFSPFFICINSQYLGFDSDIVIYFTLVVLLMSLLSEKSLKTYHYKVGH